MRILLVHDYYQQPGGEDGVFTAEALLLEGHGHRVLRYTAHNDCATAMGRVALARMTVYNPGAYRELRALIHEERPEIIHLHNTFPLISPSAYYAARAERVPVVQTLHNYRLFCPAATFFREGRVCEDCLGKSVPWPGLLHACYRSSRLATGAVAAMVTVHRAVGTWTNAVDMYIALTEFARRKCIAGSLPADKIAVKPHFVHPDPGTGRGQGGYALFVGRLSPEKGLNTLLRAWEQLRGRMPLKIVGDGPLADRVAAVLLKLPAVEWLGRRPVQDVYALIGEAAFLVVPSECYETFGRVVIEAFAKGTPVIASHIGAIGEVVDAGRTGLHFRPGDPCDLAGQVEWAVAHPAHLAQMRREARTEFETRYTAERNYGMLAEIYELAMERSRGA
jgi:glycosyltransferase involved in cell wall biosynthesis